MKFNFEELIGKRILVREKHTLDRLYSIFEVKVLEVSPKKENVKFEYAGSQNFDWENIKDYEEKHNLIEVLDSKKEKEPMKKEGIDLEKIKKEFAKVKLYPDDIPEKVFNAITTLYFDVECESCSEEAKIKRSKESVIVLSEYIQKLQEEKIDDKLTSPFQLQYNYKTGIMERFPVDMSPEEIMKLIDEDDKE